MRLGRLHSFGRYYPGPCVAVEFAPSRVNDLVDAAGRQYQKLQRTSSDTPNLPQLPYERGNLHVRKRSAMFDLADLRRFRQQIVEKGV